MSHICHCALANWDELQAIHPTVAWEWG